VVKGATVALSHTTEAPPYQAVREAVTEVEAGEDKRRVTRYIPKVPGLPRSWSVSDE